MPKICYKETAFRGESLELINLSSVIIADYQQQGFNLTLRQLYYQLVARDVIPNNERSYKRIGNLISDARLAGMIDWYAISDRTRNLVQNLHWDSPRDIIEASINQYAIDTRADQPNYIEVWVEKEALIDIVGQAARKLDVPRFACRGYVSQSEMWSASRRFRHNANNFIIHLGDHDPSGMDMTRDIRDRMAMFGADVEVRRIALNYDQIEEYSPPPNPAKITDSRAREYIAEFGRESWELDALSPATLTELITNTVVELTDMPRLVKAQNKQAAQREVMRGYLDVLDEHLED